MIDVANDIQPLSAFQRDPAGVMTRTKRTGKPVVLTVNGKARLVVQDPAAYQEMMELAERQRTLEAIREGLRDTAAGRGQPAAKVFEAIRRKFKLPRAGT